jgi:hypothetical protein
MSDASANPFDLSRDQRRGLLALLDTLIPPSDDGRLPGAGEAGVLAYLAERAADLRPLLLQGLSALDALATQRGAADFASLPPAERAAALSAYAGSDPVLLPALIFHAYCGYYQQQAVVEALGLPHRPPFPEGYELAPTDASLLDRVRELPPLYREA